MIKFTLSLIDGGLMSKNLVQLIKLCPFLFIGVVAFSSADAQERGDPVPVSQLEKYGVKENKIAEKHYQIEAYGTFSCQQLGTKDLDICEKRVNDRLMATLKGKCYSKGLQPKQKVNIWAKRTPLDTSFNSEPTIGMGLQIQCN